MSDAQRVPSAAALQHADLHKQAVALSSPVSVEADPTRKRLKAALAASSAYLKSDAISEIVDDFVEEEDAAWGRLRAGWSLRFLHGREEGNGGKTLHGARDSLRNTHTPLARPPPPAPPPRTHAHLLAHFPSCA